MIAFLEGLAVLQGQELMIVVNGVGYGVHVGGKVLGQVQDGQPLRLWVYTHVREDALELFGFWSSSDRELFKMLLSVSGVGPKTALGITDYSSEQIIHAVQTADVSLFSAVPRVGKKLAQKIIIELKPKLGSLQELHLGPRSDQERDVMEALQALGFSDTDIQRVITSLEITDEVESGLLIKRAIQLVGQKPTRSEAL